MVSFSGSTEQIDTNEMKKFIGTCVSTHILSGTNLIYNYTITFFTYDTYESNTKIYGGSGTYEV